MYRTCLKNSFPLDYYARMERYWFDWAATAPPCAHEQEAALTFALELGGNPSSVHGEGKAARKALEELRKEIASLLKVSSKELYFCSGASEANQIILYSLLLRDSPASLFSSEIEHPSVRETVAILDRLGVKVHRPRLLSSGQIDGEALFARIREEKDIRLITLLAVNNETGTKEELGKLVKGIRKAAGKRARSIHIHCDAVQILGRLPFSPLELDLDSASFSAHKISGPRGAGLLWCRKNIASLQRAGGQEGGLRGGTENLFAIKGLALAMARSLNPETLPLKVSKAEDLMAILIKKLAPNISVFPRERKQNDDRFSPFIAQFIHPRLPAEVLLRLLDSKGFAISTASACSRPSEPRIVLEALGLSREEAGRAFRISIGPQTKKEEVDALISALRKTLEE